MTDPIANEALAHTRAVGGGACLLCGSPIESLGVEQFRTGGNSGGWKLLSGELAELGEGPRRDRDVRLPDLPSRRVPTAGGGLVTIATGLRG